MESQEEQAASDPETSKAMIEPSRSAWNWRHLRSPLDFLLTRQLTRTITSTRVRSLRLFWLDGLFAAASEGMILTFIPLFALAYGATNAQVGMLAAAGSLVGALALFPGARVLEIVGKRKALVLWSSGGLNRLALPLLALIPIFTLNARNAIPLIIALVCIRAFGANFSNPAWTSLCADLVPDYMRGRYFSLRNFLMGIATLFVVPFAGWLIQSVNQRSGSSLAGYQVTFLVAFSLGITSTFYYSRIDEPPFMVQADRGRTSTLSAILASSPGLLAFVTSAFVWNLALQVAGPYFNVYLVKNLGADAATVGLTTSASTLTALFGQLIFGRLVDRKGMVWVFVMTGFAIVALPMMWSFYTSPWQVGVNNAFGGFLWAGYNLANFNLLLKLTPDEQRPRAVALYQTVVFVSAVIGPLIGGYLVDHVGFKSIFIASGLGRLSAMLLFLWWGAAQVRAVERAPQVTAQAVAEGTD